MAIEILMENKFKIQKSERSFVQPPNRQHLRISGRVATAVLK